MIATKFRDEFLKSYSEVRAAFTHERWEEVWETQGNALMLWQATQTFQPPEEIQGAGSVLRRTAEGLHLYYQNGEPLRLDSVFSRQESWFPILVAIEHENNSSGFESEVTKLLSVRCPLKVGITYTYSRRQLTEKYLKYVERIIGDSFAKISEAVGEDQITEYLFLVGTEARESPREISWYSLDFPASDGPKQRTFELFHNSQ